MKIEEEGGGYLVETSLQKSFLDSGIVLLDAEDENLHMTR